MNVKNIVRDALARYGYTFQKDFYPDLELDFLELAKKIAPYTVTRRESQYAMYKAVEYVLKHNIKGDIVECGVWRGGIAMIIAKLLKDAKSSRKLYLYDTFEGMTEPTENDVRFDGASARTRWNERKRDNGESSWVYASLEEVKSNLDTIGYEHVVYVRGPVEETIPTTMPDEIAILRLDTDWYESTKHELIHLYPRLSVGGALVIDDYGQWVGARKAYDEYVAENNIALFLNRLDHSARIGVKCAR